MAVKTTKGGKRVTVVNKGKLFSKLSNGQYVANNSLKANTQNDQSTQNDVQNQPNIPSPNVPSASKLASFQSMTSDQQADVINAAMKKGVPMHLADCGMQKLLYELSGDVKPTVVDSKTFNNTSGKMLVRAVNESFDRQKTLHFTASEVAQQIMYGRHTRVSDSGGSVHGKGLYFDTGSSAYGARSGNINKTAYVHAKYKSGTKSISESQANRGVSKEINSGSKLGKALRNMDSASRASVYALAKGYDTIYVQSQSSGYQVVLNRGCLIMDGTIYDR